jgi:hypothetical protein
MPHVDFLSVVLLAPTFIEKYRKILRDAIDRLVLIYEKGSQGSVLVEKAEDDLLKAIADIVSYFRTAIFRRDAPINCVLMSPEQPPTDEGIEILGIEPGRRAHLHCVLKITKMSRKEMEIPILRLPVYNPEGPFRDKNPLGASRAVFNCYLGARASGAPMQARRLRSQSKQGKSK